jgi:hypothetical protein
VLLWNEYLKYCGNLDLPVRFYEAELDYFGRHKYDKKALESLLRVNIIMSGSQRERKRLRCLDISS